MFKEDKRVRIITGFYGSGKSEFALNYTLGLAKEVDKVALADLDIVNTYFRSREQRKLLADHGVKLLSSALVEDNNTDLPALAAGIVGPLQDRTWQYVLDMGGSPVGLRPLAWLKPYLLPEEVDFFMVVNFNRPETDRVERVVANIRALESAGGLKLTGLIHNTNFIRESTMGNILEGQEKLKLVSSLTNIPIVYTAMWEGLAGDKNQNKLVGKILPLKLYLRQEWM